MLRRESVAWLTAADTKRPLHLKLRQILPQQSVSHVFSNAAKSNWAVQEKWQLSVGIV